jgi:hypothetical protein
MTDEDEESKRIRQRIEQIQVRRLWLQAVYDQAQSKWLIEVLSDSDEVRLKRVEDRIRDAAEGVSLKEALMNLADKIDV